MSLSVRTLSGREMIISEARPATRIETVRQQLEEKMGVLGTMRGLAMVLNSRELQDDETVLSSGWESDSTVLAVVRVLSWKQADALQRSLDALIVHPSGLEKRRALAALQYFESMPAVASTYTNLLVQCLELQSLKFGTANFTRPIREAAGKALAAAKLHALRLEGSA